MKKLFKVILFYITYITTIIFVLSLMVLAASLIWFPNYTTLISVIVIALMITQALAVAISDTY